MNATELATLSMSEIKSIAIAKGIDVVVGDKRVKATWVDAIVNFQSEQPVIEIATPNPAVPDVLSVIDKGDNMVTLQQPTPQPMPQPPTLTPQQPPTPQYHGASIVMIIPLILLSALFLLMGMAISTLIPLIGSLIRFTGSIWQSVTDIDRGTDRDTDRDTDRGKSSNAQAHPLPAIGLVTAKTSVTTPENLVNWGSNLANRW